MSKLLTKSEKAVIKKKKYIKQINYEIGSRYGVKNMCNLFDIEGDSDGSQKAALVKKADEDIVEFEEMLSKV
jgi:hypothetical protein